MSTPSKVPYENAKKEFERQIVLLDDGIVSVQEYDRYALDLQVAKTTYENAQITSAGQLKIYEAELEIRKEEFSSAQNNLQLLREGATSNSKQVSNIVASTLTGMVLTIPLEEGSSVIERNNFNEGSSIAIVADMNELIFEGKVDESEVGKLTEGMSLKLTVGAIEDEKFDAMLEHISPKRILEEGTVKFEVVAAIQPTQDVFLRAGYSASGDIILEKKDSVLAINERDMIIEGDSTFIEIKVGDQEFDKRMIETGLSDGIMIEVLSGVDTTDQIKVIQD